jgi:hypothetical protein
MTKFFLAAGFVLVATVAFAASTLPASVSLDIGGALSALLAAFGGLIALVLAGIIYGRLPPFAKLFVSDAAIQTAILNTISTTAGVIAREPVVNVQTSNLLILGTLNFLKASWPGILHWIISDVEPYVIAQLQVAGAIPKDATAETLGADKAAKS